MLAGDSAGGGLALAVALTLRDRGGPQPSHLLLHSPWVDLTTSTPETHEVTKDDPWLFIGKMQAYAEWWAGSPDDLGRPEVSPGARRPGRAAAGADVLRHPRLALRRAAGCWSAAAEEAGWPLTYVEEPGLIHVYPILPFIPEAARAWRQTLAFLDRGARDEDLGGARSPRSTRSRRTASGSCARTSSWSSRSAPTPTSTAATSSPRPGTW